MSSSIPPPELKDGDALEPWMVNYLIRFARAWAKPDVSPPLNFAFSGSTPPRFWLGDIDDLVPVLTPSGGIAAGSYTSPTSGSGTLLVEMGDGPGFATSAGDTVDVYNPYGKTVTASVFAWAKWRGPYLYLVTWDC